MSRALWIPWAIRRPGPAEKPDGPRSSSRGVVFHSSGGGSLSGALGELDKPNNINPSNWQGTVDYDGTLYQHYPLDLHCDHAGDHEFNDSTLGFEFVGWHGGLDWQGRPNPWEPWTVNQFLTGVRLLRWLEAETWIPTLSRSGANKSCYRHYEIVPTACDGNRAPWDRLLTVANQPDQEEDDMTDAERQVYAAFHQCLAQVWRARDGQPAGLPAATKFILMAIIGGNGTREMSARWAGSGDMFSWALGNLALRRPMGERDKRQLRHLIDIAATL